MPTAAQIDRACKEGKYVHVKGQQVSGATSNYHGDEALAGNVHVYMTKTGLWDEVKSDSVIITDQPFTKKETKEMPPENIVDATRVRKGAGKNTGKRSSGDGHVGPPTRAAASKSKPKGDATSSLKDLGEIVGVKAEAPPAEAKAKKPAKDKGAESAPVAEAAGKPEKKKGKSTVTVSRTSAKQGELPGVQTSKRKVVEIETLAEELETRKDEKKAADDRFKDAEENLIASMKRHDRVFYSRSTWGSVVLKETKESARFKREKGKPVE